MSWVWAGAVLGLALLVLLYLFWPRRRSPAEQARLERAAARIDTELAGNLELVTMYGQTRQAVVMEVAAYREARGAIVDADAALARRVDALYELIPYAEDATTRRGPAGSISAADRSTVNTWEAGARDLQHALRALPRRRPQRPGDRLLARLRPRAEERQAIP